MKNNDQSKTWYKKLCKKGRVSVPAIAALGVIVVVLSGVMYFITPSKKENETARFAPPVLKVADNTSLQGFMSKSVSMSGSQKSFMSFSAADLDLSEPDSAISKYKAKKDALIANSTLQPADALKKYVSKTVKTIDNGGVFYMFNNSNTTVSLQDIADSIKPQEDLLFVILKYDAERKDFHMTDNDFYSKDHLDMVYDLTDEDNNSKNVEIKAGEGFLIVANQGFEILNSYNGDIVNGKTVTSRYNLCDTTTEGWYNFAVKDNLKISDHYKGCEDRVGVVWPQIHPESCKYKESEYAHLAPSERDLKSEQCFSEKPDGTSYYDLAKGVNYIRIYDDLIDGFKDLDVVANYEMVGIGKTNKRLVWVYMEEGVAPHQNEDIDDDDDTTIVCPEGASLFEDKCMAPCTVNEDYQLENAHLLTGELVELEKSGDTWLEAEACSAVCNGEFIPQNDGVPEPNKLVCVEDINCPDGTDNVDGKCMAECIAPEGEHKIYQTDSDEVDPITTFVPITCPWTCEDGFHDDENGNCIADEEDQFTCESGLYDIYSEDNTFINLEESSEWGMELIGILENNEVDKINVRDSSRNIIKIIFSGMSEDTYNQVKNILDENDVDYQSGCFTCSDGATLEDGKCKAACSEDETHEPLKPEDGATWIPAQVDLRKLDQDEWGEPRACEWTCGEDMRIGEFVDEDYIRDVTEDYLFNRGGNQMSQADRRYNDDLTEVSRTPMSEAGPAPTDEEATSEKTYKCLSPCEEGELIDEVNGTCVVEEILCKTFLSEWKEIAGNTMVENATYINMYEKSTTPDPFCLEWECSEGYHESGDGESCIPNTKQATCREHTDAVLSSANKRDIITQEEVTWYEPTGSWSETDMCDMECIDGVEYFDSITGGQVCCAPGQEVVGNDDNMHCAEPCETGVERDEEGNCMVEEDYTGLKCEYGDQIKAEYARIICETEGEFLFSVDTTISNTNAINNQLGETVMCDQAFEKLADKDWKCVPMVTCTEQYAIYQKDSANQLSVTNTPTNSQEDIYRTWFNYTNSVNNIWVDGVPTRATDENTEIKCISN